jgi:alkyldihydroxyacetonephosphate synthase
VTEAVDIVTGLQNLLGADRVSTDAATLQQFATDTWPLRLAQAAVGGPRRERPLAVIHPTSVNEVSASVRYLGAHGVAVVPRAGGSGVQGGAEPPAGSVVLDVGALDQVLDFDAAGLTVTAQAGIGLAQLESWLGERGFTCGHYPQSIDTARLGGLVATRSSGQFSTRYGSIEDLLAGLEVVLADGTVVHIDRRAPRRSAGPDLRQVFVGSEGTLGVITEVSLHVFPVPAERWLAAYAVASMRDGLDVLQRIVQSGWRPAVLRLYDPVETQRGFAEFVPERDACLLLCLSEGPHGLPALEGAAISEAVRQGGGQPLGQQPVQRWLGHRNDVSDFYTYLNAGMIVDTIDVSASWSRIADLYEAVLGALQHNIRELVVASAHASHCYAQGANLYFVLGAQPPRDAASVQHVYDCIWSTAMEAVLAAGGSICHHHGIGKLRAPWLQRELGSAHVVLERLKAALDPRGIMNPGTLLSRPPVESDQ